MAENVILAEQTYDGFAYDSEFEAYRFDVSPSPFTIVLGEVYSVVWDDVLYSCKAQDMSVFGEGVLALGDLSYFGGDGNDEPFVIGWAQFGITIFAFDTATSHTVAIYQVVSQESDIVLKDRAGNDIDGLGGAAELKVPLKGGGFKRFTAGTRVDKVMTAEEVNFSAGDITVTPEEGEIFKSVLIPKPVSLVPENILKDVNIAGIIGNVVASGGGGGTFIYKDGTVTRTQGTNSSMVITHGLGVVPSIVLFYIADPVKTSLTYLSSAIGFNDAMLAALGGGYLNKINVVSSGGGVMGMGANTGIEHGPMDSYREACIRYADENTFTVGNVTYKVMSGYQYQWIAIGGIV